MLTEWSHMGYVEDLAQTKAGKLHNILEKARNYTGQRSIADGWAHVFEVPPQYPTYILDKLKKLTDLVEAVNKDLVKAEVAKEYYQESLINIQTIVNDSSLNMRHDWPSVIAKITPELLSTLKFCALLSNQKLLNKNIPIEEIKEFIKRTNELKDEFEKSAVEEALKSRILNLFEEAISALREYEMFGGESVVHVFRKAIGDIAIYNKLIIDEPEKEMISKFWEFLKGLNTLVSMSRNGQYLLEMSNELLKIVN
jgi:hypothetical protein